MVWPRVAQREVVIQQRLWPGVKRFSAWRFREQLLLSTHTTDGLEKRQNSPLPSCCTVCISWERCSGRRCDLGVVRVVVLVQKATMPSHHQHLSDFAERPPRVALERALLSLGNGDPMSAAVLRDVV